MALFKIRDKAPEEEDYSEDYSLASSQLDCPDEKKRKKNIFLTIFIALNKYPIKFFRFNWKHKEEESKLIYYLKSFGNQLLVLIKLSIIGIICIPIYNIMSPYVFEQTIQSISEVSIHTSSPCYDDLANYTINGNSILNILKNLQESREIIDYVDEKNILNNPEFKDISIKEIGNYISIEDVKELGSKIKKSDDAWPENITNLMGLIKGHYFNAQSYLLTYKTVLSEAANIVFYESIDKTIKEYNKTTDEDKQIINYEICFDEQRNEMCLLCYLKNNNTIKLDLDKSLIAIISISHLENIDEASISEYTKSVLKVANAEHITIDLENSKVYIDNFYKPKTFINNSLDYLEKFIKEVKNHYTSSTQNSVASSLRQRNISEPVLDKASLTNACPTHKELRTTKPANSYSWTPGQTNTSMTITTTNIQPKTLKKSL